MRAPDVLTVRVREAKAINDVVDGPHGLGAVGAAEHDIAVALLFAVDCGSDAAAVKDPARHTVRCIMSVVRSIGGSMFADQHAAQSTTPCVCFFFGGGD